MVTWDSIKPITVRNTKVLGRADIWFFSRLNLRRLAHMAGTHRNQQLQFQQQSKQWLNINLRQKINMGKKKKINYLFGHFLESFHNLLNTHKHWAPDVRLHRGISSVNIV
ncbi:unnamed protein product [Candidula unifasciata]|uniref:Uncharacterized protein n=1 Tax=Candidula unifasciata TaxID=100452 RepID=A0A8S3ZNU9_9EUPU|nr:unnamed protein product [Candidula unifasciata]